MPRGGGGGTFITRPDKSPLIIAGGGGGGGLTLPGYGNGDPGQAGTNGARHGESGGTGGDLYNEISGDSAGIFAGSGAGLISDGSRPSIMMRFNFVAKSFNNGGRGGLSALTAESEGGFGGGGFPLLHPGGGGGYSGGGVTVTKLSGFAGGGGSYNGGSDQENEEGVNKGDGRVVIQMHWKEMKHV